MSTHPVIVEIFSENGQKTITFDCSWSTNVWEVTQLLSNQLSEEKHKHRDENSIMSGTIVLRDQHGTRLEPNNKVNKVNRKKETHLFAEIVKEGGAQEIDRIQHDKVKRSRGRAAFTSKRIIPAEDGQEIDNMNPTEESKAKLRKTNARSPSPKNKRRKTDDKDSESQLDTPPSFPSLCKVGGGDTDRTVEIKTKRKSRKRLELEHEETITKQQEHQCVVCGGPAANSPTLRLGLKRRFESDQSPSRVNLTLHQRSCTMCSDDRQNKSASSEYGRKTRKSKIDSVLDTKQATVNEMGSLEKKPKNLDASSPREDKLSRSLQNISLEDTTTKPERSSLNVVPRVQKEAGRNAKKSTSAMTWKEIPTVELTKMNSAMFMDGNHTRGKIKDPKLSLCKLVDTNSICSGSDIDEKTIPANKPRDITEEHVDDNRQGGKTKDTDLVQVVVDLVDTESKCSESAIKDANGRETAERSVDGKRKCGKTKGANTPVTEHVDTFNKDTSAFKKGSSGCKNARQSTGRPVDGKRKDGKTKDTTYGKTKDIGLMVVDCVDAGSESSDSSIHTEATADTQDAVIRKNTRYSTEKPVEVKSRYFSTTTNMETVEAITDRKHSETKSVDIKKSTVDNDMCSSTSINKVAEKSTDKLVDIGRKHSETPVKTLDSRMSTTTWEINVKKHRIPVLADDHQPKILKIVIEQAGVDEADGLCKSKTGSEVDVAEDDSFINDVDGDGYEEHNDVPVEIGDSQECLKDIHSISEEGDPVVVNIGKNELKSSDLDTLEEGEWLNDCVINAYFFLLTESAPLRIFTHSSFFFFSVYKRGYEGVQRWTKNVDLFAQDIVFIPIHNKSHWTLVVVHIKDGIIEYYNSSTILDGYPRSMMHVRDYLKAEAMHRGKTAFCNISWEMYIVDQIPRQQNMDDCGLFICQYAKKLSLKQKVSFDIETTTNLRRQMLRELVRSKIEEY